MRHQKHECPRCGCQWDARNSAYRDELIAWIQHCSEIEAAYRQRIARLQETLVHTEWDLDYYRTLCGHLVVPSIEQIELMALRGQLAEVEQGGPICEEPPPEAETEQEELWNK